MEGSVVAAVVRFLHQLAARSRLVSAGITAVCFHGVHDPDKPDEEQLGIITLWHALVALTSDTDVRLRLRSEPAVWRKSPTDCMRLLSAPSRTELVQRLTALDVCVWEADNVTAVYSLAALRHLRLWSAVKNTALEMFAIAPGAEPPPCQLSELRTLQLHDIWPEAFFTPGVGASLQQLRSVCLRDCLFEEHMPDVPDELLRLPSLERLELIRLPLLCLPDMRELPALRTLVVSDGPVLRFDFAPMGIFGRATALTHLSLHDTPVEDRRLLMSLSACRT